MIEAIWGINISQLLRNQASFGLRSGTAAIVQSPVIRAAALRIASEITPLGKPGYNISAIAEDVEFIAIQVTEIGCVKPVAALGTQARRALIGATELNCFTVDPVNLIA